MWDRWFSTITWVNTIFGIVGVVLNAQMNVWGFYFWIPSNIVWIIINIKKGIYAQAVVFVVYLFMCFYGIHEWTTK